MAIIGPNGAGKTTLFRLLLGIAEADRGNIKMFGEQPHRGNPHIGYVPQRHQIDREMTIESIELVRMRISGQQWGPGTFSKDDKQTALDAMKAVGARGPGPSLARRAFWR